MYDSKRVYVTALLLLWLTLVAVSRQDSQQPTGEPHQDFKQTKDSDSSGESARSSDANDDVTTHPNWETVDISEVHDGPTPSKDQFTNSLRNVFVVMSFKTVVEQQQIQWYASELLELFPVGLNHVRIAMAGCLTHVDYVSSLHRTDEDVPQHDSNPVCEDFRFVLRYSDWRGQRSKTIKVERLKELVNNMTEVFLDHQHNYTRHWWGQDGHSHVHEDLAEEEDDVPDDTKKMPSNYRNVKRLHVFPMAQRMYRSELSDIDDCDEKTGKCGSGANNQLLVFFEYHDAAWIEDFMNTKRSFGSDLSILFLVPEDIRGMATINDDNGGVMVRKHKWSDTYVVRLRYTRMATNEIWEPYGSMDDDEAWQTNVEAIVHVVARIVNGHTRDFVYYIERERALAYAVVLLVCVSRWTELDARAHRRIADALLLLATRADTWLRRHCLFLYGNYA